MYAPINIPAFIAAYAGAISGMAVNGWIVSPVESSYELQTEVTGAFAQAFDIAWNDATALNLLEIEAIQSVCAAQFAQRGPGPSNAAQFQDPTTWTVAAEACVALIRESDAYFAAQGIIPPAFGGGGAPLTLVYYVDNLTDTDVTNQTGSESAPFSSIQTAANALRVAIGANSADTGTLMLAQSPLSYGALTLGATWNGLALVIIGVGGRDFTLSTPTPYMGAVNGPLMAQLTLENVQATSVTTTAGNIALNNGARVTGSINASTVGAGVDGIVNLDSANVTTGLSVTCSQFEARKLNGSGALTITAYVNGNQGTGEAAKFRDCPDLNLNLTALGTDGPTLNVDLATHLSSDADPFVLSGTVQNPGPFTLSASATWTSSLIAIGGTAAGVFPTAVAPTPTVFDASSVNHAALLPPVTTDGDLLIIAVSLDNDAATVTLPAELMLLTEQTNTGVKLLVYGYIASGVEDGLTIDFVSNVACRGVSQVYRIPVGTWDGSLSSLVTQSVASSGSSASPDPAGLSPPWSRNTLWIAISASPVFGTTVSAYPAGYSSGTMTRNTAGTGVTVGSAQLSVASNWPTVILREAAGAASFSLIGWDYSLRPELVTLPGNKVYQVGTGFGMYPNVHAALLASSQNPPNPDARALIQIMPGKYVSRSPYLVPARTCVQGANKFVTQMVNFDSDMFRVTGQHTQFCDFLIEGAPTEALNMFDYNDQSNGHIRNVDALSNLGNNRQNFLRQVGATWATLFIENCIIDSFKQSGYVLFLNDTSGAVRLNDVIFDNIFFDAYGLTTFGGSILLRNTGDVRVTDSTIRGVAVNNTGIRLEDTGVGGTPDLLVSNSYLEGGVPVFGTAGTNYILTNTDAIGALTSGTRTLRNSSV